VAARFFSFYQLPPPFSFPLRSGRSKVFKRFYRAITRRSYARNFTAPTRLKLIYPLATTVMVPVAGLCYRTVGLAPLFVFNALAFFTAASFETRIRAPEPHLLARRTEVRFDRLRYRRDFREGLSYLRSEPGLVRITAFFFFMMMAGTFMTTLYLPYFRSAPGHSVERTHYPGGLNARPCRRTIHYRFRYPTGKRKFGSRVGLYRHQQLDGGYLSPLTL
jgi:hypothetical protein